jgi:allantoate deiminase
LGKLPGLLQLGRCLTLLSRGRQSHFVDTLSHSTQAVLTCCEVLSQFTETSGTIQRTFLCDEMHDVHYHLRAWMERLGMTVSVDAAGNLRGLYSAMPRGARRLVIGSHLDTVPNAGAYDGVLGVVLGIALVERLSGERLSHSIEVIGFSEEEGVRFGIPFLGSRAVVGLLDQTLLQRRDADGVSVSDAIRGFGLDCADLPKAVLDPSASAYLEIHVEQGPLLEKAGLPLGYVASIAGQARATVAFQGKANHAGTAPMALRQDVLCAAAEWILDVEREGRRTHGLVSTVGKIDVAGGAGNVVCGLVHASLDVRHGDDQVRQQAFEKIVRSAREIALRRGIKFQHELTLNQPAVAMNPKLVELAAASIEAAGVRPLKMVSGAGHDSMVIAEKLPSAMIFVRSPGGISHHPDETVLFEDVRAALIAGDHFLRKLSIEELENVVP